MATTLEIVRGISQAAANAYDGALDEDGKPLEIGLRREQGHLIKDSRVMDGFGVTFHGPFLCINYHSEIQLKEVHSNGFETEIAQSLTDISNFLKKEYKKVTGKSLSLSFKGEPKILVQSLSHKKSWIQARQFYKIGGIKKTDSVLDLGKDASKERLNDAIKNFLSLKGK